MTDKPKTSKANSEDSLEQLLDEEQLVDLIEAAWQNEGASPKDRQQLQRNWLEIKARLKQPQPKKAASKLSPLAGGMIILSMAAALLLVLIQQQWLQPDRSQDYVFKGGDQDVAPWLVDIKLQAMDQETVILLSLRDPVLTENTVWNQLAILAGDQTAAAILWQGPLADLPSKMTYVGGEAFEELSKVCAIAARDEVELRVLSQSALSHWDLMEGRFCLGQ